MLKRHCPIVALGAALLLARGTSLFAQGADLLPDPPPPQAVSDLARPEPEPPLDPLPDPPPPQPVLEPTAVPVAAPVRDTVAPPSRSVGVDAAHAAIRADTLEDLAVRNGSGQQIGEVRDVVLDVHTGAIRYVAVSCGDFLGIGGKLFAIPWRALEVRYDLDRRGHFLFLRATAEDMARAPGFPPNQWPNFADERWTNENDTYFLQYEVIRKPVLVREPKGQPVAPELVPRD